MKHLSSNKNKTKILLILFVLIIIVYNLIWLINWYPYHNKTNEYSPMPKGWYRVDEQYIFTIKEPDYLSFTGNYAICTYDGVALLIWPNLFHLGELEYGIQIEENENAYRFYIDGDLEYKEKDMNYTDEEIIGLKGLINEKYDILLSIMEVAKSEWNLKM